MYSRVYQGRPKELPENYHGTAFSREDVEDGGQALPEIEYKQESPAAVCEEVTPNPACDTTPKGEERPREREGEENLFSELLLLVICALMMESEAPDTRLLALLLLLLLSPASA